MQQVSLIEPLMADPADVALFHTNKYIDFVKEKSIEGSGFLDYGDTPAFKGIYETSLFIVGASLDAVEKIMKGPDKRAFIPIGRLQLRCRYH